MGGNFNKKKNIILDQGNAFLFFLYMKAKVGSKASYNWCQACQPSFFKRIILSFKASLFHTSYNFLIPHVIVDSTGKNHCVKFEPFMPQEKHIFLLAKKIATTNKRVVKFTYLETGARTDESCNLLLYENVQIINNSNN